MKVRTVLKVVLFASASWRVSVFSGTSALLSSNLLLKKEVFHRIEVLKNYAPSLSYCWKLRWFEKGQCPMEGQLKGRVEGKFHWIEVFFASGDKLSFDKNNPRVAFYPNILCLYPEHEWLNPLGDHHALCYHLIAMPFLYWPIESFKKTAKMGRRAIQVVFSKSDIRIEVFIDQAFNAILQVVIRISGDVYGKFSLNHFKRFGQDWGMGCAEYTLMGRKAKLKVISIEN